MAQQIKKKYLGADSVDGSKLKLLQGQAIRGLDESGAEVDLLKIDDQGKVKADGAEIAFKSQVDAEATSRAQAISELSSTLTAAITSAVASEATSRQSADDLLDGRLDTLEGNSAVVGSVEYKVKQSIDALLNNAPAAYDTLKEIADYIASDATAAAQVTASLTSLDERLDTVEGSGVGSFAYADAQLQSAIQSAINSAVNGEATSRANADSALSGRLDTLEGQNLNSRLGTLEADPVTKTYVNAEVDAVETRVGVLEGHNLDSRLDTLEADPTTKAYVDGQVSSLDGRLDTIEGNGPGSIIYAVQTEQTARLTFQAGIDGRVSAIEGQNLNTRLTAAEGDIDGLDIRLDVLEGANNIVGSVEYKIKQSIDGLVNSASSAYDTLKEIEDYINSDVSAAAQVQSTLTSHGTRLSTIEGSGAGSFAYADSQLETALTAAITSQVGAEQTARISADNALDARIDVLEADPGTEYQVVAAAHYNQQGVAVEFSLQDSTPLVVDGVTIAAGEKVLLHGQINSDKGIYQYSESGGQYTLTKVESASFIVGKKFYVQKGSQFANSTWVLSQIVSGQPLMLIAGFKPFHVPASMIPFESSVLDMGVSAKRWRYGYFGTVVAQDMQPYTVTMQEGGKIMNLSNGTAAGDAVNKGQLDAINSALDSRLDVLEAAVDGPQFSKEKIVLGSGDLSYIDLQAEAVANSIFLSVGRLMGHKDEDFTVSVVSGKTRITWSGSFASPGGAEAVEVGDSVFVTYAVLA